MSVTEFPVDQPICEECGQVTTVDRAEWNEGGGFYVCRDCIELERKIAEDVAREEALKATCTVCGVEWVDVMNGEDTCAGCQRDG